MKIIIAPDSFKESLTAAETARQIEAGFREVLPHATYVRFPIADGGEGTVDALLEACGGARRTATVTDPLGRPVEATYGILRDSTAVIELAAASGLNLVSPTRRDPRFTTTLGTGELIRHALDAGSRKFIIGIGGSATNDGGAGLLSALGARFLDSAGAPLPLGGLPLADLANIDLSGLDPRVHLCQFDVACDVDNPLIGAEGASAVFGPQKGATSETIELLDNALRNYAAVMALDLGINVASTPGAGAAGGVGAAFLGVLKGALRPGIDIVTEAMNIAGAVREADLVLTGEGRIDGQTARGKAPIGIAKIARLYGVPVIAVGGGVLPSSAAVFDAGIAAVFPSVQRACTLEEALLEAGANVKATARNIAATLQVGVSLKATFN
ncbi:glycerate kinase 1 [Burkholderia sp. THE68]|uniref:glycerate kinase n=1 Tax=Burkholderia sp. THE68 TaxID=758782 RepID=UPI0013168575|nr:glycerate kinase [Burkholderia sp. THE68]BBU30370.1 glycerate kinase 1 [Burkholderia sp. THE68]